MALTLHDLLPLLKSLSDDPAARRSLAELSALSGTSESTFQRAFSRLVGESPKQFKKRLQLELAAVQLLSTSARVIDVALDAGFESHEGFTRAFTQHFKKSPKGFRQQAAAAGLHNDPLFASLISLTGPCVGLFRQPLTPSACSPKENKMNYDITQQGIGALTFLHGRADCTHAEVATELGKLLPAAFAHAVGNNIAMMGPPVTLYPHWGPGMVTLHAGVPVGEGATAGDGLFVDTYPAGKAAVTIHTGPYDGLGDAHAALEQYLSAEGLKKGGPGREVYLTDPGEVPDPAQWKTQVIWPIAD